MGVSRWRLPAWAALMAGYVLAADIVYVTDIEIYTYLAPCVTEALYYNIGSVTSRTQCANGETALQSCVCANTKDFQQIQSTVSADVFSSCGTWATSDQSSASMVLDKYCHPDKTIAFSTPTANVVNAYITERPELSYLPPCAQTGVSYAVMGQMLSKCPRDASLYAPCVCNSDRAKIVSSTLSQIVRSTCSNNEDVSAAQTFYKQYCAMNDGTTSFDGAPYPPGDMTYYITAMPTFKSLRACAQSAVSDAVMGQMSWQCAKGPQALASCACIKSGMFGKVSSTLTSNVKYYCESTAIDDVTSAASVLEYYCSAAESKVVATVAESASQPQPTGVQVSRTQPGSSIPSETGSGQDGSNDGSKDGSSPNDGKSSGGTNKVAIIAASVLGGVVAIALVVGIIFFMRRRNRRKKQGEQIPQVGSDGGADGYGNDPSKHSPSVVTSMPELSSPAHTPRPELQGGSRPHELPSQNWMRPEHQTHEMPGSNPMTHQPPPDYLTPTTGQQMSPQSYQSYGSPMAVSPGSQAQGGQWVTHGGESFEMSHHPQR